MTSLLLVVGWFSDVTALCATAIELAVEGGEGTRDKVVVAVSPPFGLFAVSLLHHLTAK